ncbi:hypothetical protein CONCODRAFT_20733 [Conidiobolus coronatus NRRL 28638]|uniref:F-box domain-containing protein n=1 Tax=Conidiobolus coronatus (strain ATCC 28846 / CBS 209.66 / NRRL 28638) TaxID=796925 RepID=A0A137NRR3_CONC2|nr:hypothetical protein CONCODRAFT_20733 [Conidiobolus coronatus NRRL 28638]|eukprot:KXN65431.1 hypothetical protein CONCODRAFT_20733 [Conidiobolus coronatus NRRL 28638]
MIQISAADNNTNNWEYLPDTDIFYQYFKQNDLIELSKVCKNYRAFLKPQVLKKLHIDNRVHSYLDICTYDKKRAYENIIDSLKINYADNFNLVREVIIKYGFTSEFACDFFALFPKISSIKINSSGSHSLKNLINTLHNSKYLKHVSINSNFRRFSPLLDDVYHSFFYQLKSIHISVPPLLVETQLPFDIINSSYTNLKRLTVVNSRILSKLSNGIPYLLYVEFSHEYQFNLAELKSFISNNYQLNQISISDRHLDEKIINSILTLKNLYKLEIAFSRPEMISFNICIENYSIKHFIYTGYGLINYNSVIFDILKMCKNLKVYQVSNVECYEDVMRNEFPVIDTLLLSRLFYSNISKLVPKSSKFNQIKFVGGCRFGTIYDQLLKYPDVKWVPKQGYTRETDEFTFMNKLF